MISTKFENGTIYNEDCLKVFPTLEKGSVDMILCDLPYGTTQNQWDTVIPYEEMWQSYWDVLKPNGAVVLTSAQPFTSSLVMSQVKHFKYEWIWVKSRVTGFLNAKIQPLRQHESVLVFYKEQPTYNPQGTSPISKVMGVQKSKASGRSTENYGQLSGEVGDTYVQNTTGYPRSILEIDSVSKDIIHPTQKPVELFEYLIKTYTNKGETVLDNTSGSGTTAIAAENTKRKWICMEMDETHYANSSKRIADQIKVNASAVVSDDMFNFGEE